MRKILVVLVLVAVLVGGYTAYWFKKADDFKQMLGQSIATLNDKAKALDSKDTLLRYTAINASGYPFSMTLEITKPILDIPMSAILQNFPRAAGAAPAPAFEWVEEISYGDSVSLSSNITGNRFTLTMAGDRTHTTLVDRAIRHTISASTSEPSICHLAVQETAGVMPWTMQPVFPDPKTFLAVFRSADCINKAATAKDLKSGAPLMSSDESSVSISNDIDGVYHKLAFKLDSKNLKATPAFDALLNDYMTMTHTLLGTPENQRMAMAPMSTYGNQNVKIDIAYEGPTDSGSFGDPAMHFRFDINALDMKSDLFDMGLGMHVTSSPASDKRDASLKIHSHSEVSDAYDQLMAKQFTTVLNQMKQDTSNIGPQALAAQTITKLGTPEEVTAALLPKFHSFGKTTFDTDASVKGPNNGRELFIRGIYNLDALNWIATPYGIKFKGNANISVPGKMPTGELMTTCLTCDALITDLGNYVMRIEALTAHLQNPPQPPRVTKDLIEGIRQFLHGIAENGSAQDLVIHIVVKDAGDITVSGKQIPQVMGLFAQTIAPQLQQRSPAVPMPAPPPPSVHPPSGR